MHRWHRIILPLAALVMVTGVAWPGGTATAAQDGKLWQKMGTIGGVAKLLTPPSGPLFATRRSEVLRSDDAGESWAPVSLPPRPASPALGFVFALDPTNHTIMYANGAEGLYKTTSDAASWTLVLPTSEVTTALSVSQADPNVIYLSLADKPGPEVTRYRIVRSRDGGASWEQIEDLAKNCQVNTYQFMPHPLDPRRVMRPQVCNPGGSTNGALAESTDQGTSWTKRFDRAGTRPIRMVVGEGAMPGRFYMSLWHGASRRTLLLRSDDDGATWSNTTEPWSIVELSPETWQVDVNGFDTDLTTPDRVYAALNVQRAPTQTPGAPGFLFSRVLVSEDAGLTWSDTGFGGESFVNDLKLGIDGRNLYVSTASGVWRLPVGVGS